MIAVLGDKTFPQIRAIDQAFQNKHGKTLAQVIAGDKALKGPCKFIPFRTGSRATRLMQACHVGFAVEYGLRGLVLGPLNFDVWLIQKATESSAQNSTQVDAALIDVLVARSPADMQLLRTAYRHHLTKLKHVAVKHKSLEEAVLACYTGKAKIKKAWELTLQGRWEDNGDVEEGVGALSAEQRAKLLTEDVDQLKVALRKAGGDHAMVYVPFSLGRSLTSD